MFADHLALVFSGPELIRLTVGRLAVPMFFLLAGHLARRPRWRHALVALVGVLLPVLVPWVDSPNVLVWWALGVVLLWGGRLAGVPAWVWPVLAATLAANGWAPMIGTGYNPWALWALMALGQLVPRDWFSWAGRLPGWVGALGRRPVWVYAGHLLALQAFVLVATGRV